MKASDTQAAKTLAMQRIEASLKPWEFDTAEAFDVQEKPMTVLKVFQHFNPHGDACPVCKTKADRPTVLMQIPGTEDGMIIEARQVHKDCYDATNSSH